ncbi:MAG: hypothetical protein HKN21_04700 [Candidatus Eisenbacteria bacterium]|uniref:PEP-CTERM sorting domain-containing protein n=1 Tax=Eiseniibacteriota bacterium TaxID=2212470 RepID=A0A7Y2H1U7_UNCEI|nr:hypothetical protein [Candidatus Eisenbacteria bacterium]
MKKLATSLVAVLALGLSVSAVSAQTVSSNVEGLNDGVLTSDPQGPSATAVTSALTFIDTFTIDFSGDGFGRAVQRPDGIGAVVADALFANGQTGQYVEATTCWEETATNTSGAAQDYEFSFLITPPSLRVGDFAGASDLNPNRPEISFEATILVNGSVAFTAQAELLGGTVSHVLNETGTSLSPVFVGPGSVFGYDFSPYADVLNLGSVPNGGSVTVKYIMKARVDTPGFELGGRAQIGDPFDLDGTPGFTGELMPSSPVATEESSWGQIKKGLN